MDRRPSVPADVMRALRKEAGFGCCVCGFPIFEYHHIIPYADEKHFRPQDMMLLCPICHSRATAGAMPIAKQREYKANPNNKRRRKAHGLLYTHEKAVAVSIGSNQFINDGNVLLINDEPLLRIRVNSEGQIAVSVKLYDSKNVLLASVEDNEWTTGEDLPWDLQCGWKWLRINQKQRDVVLHVDARKSIVSVQGVLWFNGQRFDLTTSDLHINGGAFKPKVPTGTAPNVSFAELCFVGGSLVATTLPPAVQIVPNPRFGQMYLVSNPDTEVRIRQGRDAWAALVTGKDAPPIHR